MSTLVLVPARIASTRLPGKPLAPIHGRPMIVHVAERAREADVGRVVVATDSEDVASAVRAAGFEAVMTRADHPSGSDRIFEALRLVDPEGLVDTVVNLQGDLPTVEPATVRASLRALADPACDIGTVVVPIENGRDRADPSVVKAVLAGGGEGDAPRRALYFTRATAPTGEGPLFHHVGIYAYRRAALERFVALPPGALERRETLEQLRALEAGMRIDVCVVDAVPLGVDTPRQLEEARRLLAPAGGATRIAFQGEPGANSDIACEEMFPGRETLPCASFDDAFRAVAEGEAELAMIPIENTLAGRVADVHHLLPQSGLRIVGEHFLPIHFHFMALPGVGESEIRTIHSHVHALGQCRTLLNETDPATGRPRWRGRTEGDTAGSARLVRDAGDRSMAALAPRRAAEIYGLAILRERVEDDPTNQTRFVVLRRPEGDERALWAPAAGGGEPTPGVVTTFVFDVRNIPAALYKALGGFATNGVNMTKLESYQVGGRFTATRFYADVIGHPDDAGLARALAELEHFTTDLQILGVYRFASTRPLTD